MINNDSNLEETASIDDLGESSSINSDHRVLIMALEVAQVSWILVIAVMTHLSPHRTKNSLLVGPISEL